LNSGKKSYSGQSVNFIERRIIEYDMSEAWGSAKEEENTDFRFVIQECNLEGTEGGHQTFYCTDGIVASAKEYGCSEEFIGLLSNAKCWGVQWVQFNL